MYCEGWRFTCELRQGQGWGKLRHQSPGGAPVAGNTVVRPRHVRLIAEVLDHRVQAGWHVVHVPVDEQERIRCTLRVFVTICQFGF